MLSVSNKDITNCCPVLVQGVQHNSLSYGRDEKLGVRGVEVNKVIIKMAKPYAYELRTRALKLIDEGMNIGKVKELLNISRQTLYTWKQIMKEQGHVKPKEGYQKGHSNKITNYDEFRELLDGNKDKSLRELASIYGKCSAATIWRGIQKLRYSYKKKLYTS